jgi:nucleotidyltransferase/DNA polymerase involved in DNA repair
LLNREVGANRIRKSVGAENTFSGDLTEFDAMVLELQPLIDEVWRHCDEKGSRGRTVTLKMKFNDFVIITRSRSGPTAVVGRVASERDAGPQASAAIGRFALIATERRPGRTATRLADLTAVRVRDALRISIPSRPCQSPLGIVSTSTAAPSSS